jgi:hypothetical protein
MTLGITTFSITTLRRTIEKRNTQHNSEFIVFYWSIMSIEMRSVVMLNVIMLTVIMQSVVAPLHVIVNNL